MKLRSPRLRLLGRVDDLAIYLVDGEHVRNEIDVDFVNGGNSAVYPRYIQRDEIWIDDAQHVLDRTATALHELIERDLMLRHGRSYDRAHDEANVYERGLRGVLARHRPTTFSARGVAQAYRAYLRGQSVRRSGRQLDQEINAALVRRRHRSG